MRAGLCMCLGWVPVRAFDERAFDTKPHNHATQFDINLHSGTNAAVHMDTRTRLRPTEAYTGAALKHTCAEEYSPARPAYASLSGPYQKLPAPIRRLLELPWLGGGLLPKQNAFEAYAASQAWRCPSARLCRTRPRTFRASPRRSGSRRPRATSRLLRLDTRATPPPRHCAHAGANEIACMPSGRASSTFCLISSCSLLGCCRRRTLP